MKLFPGLRSTEGFDDAQIDETIILPANKRLRVTVTDEIFFRLEDWGRSRGQDVRSIILSEAMRKLGNASEAKILEGEIQAEPDRAEVEKMARETIFENCLKRICHYDLENTLMRYRGGHRMSDGMGRDIKKAQVDASKIISEHSWEYENAFNQA